MNDIKTHYDNRFFIMRGNAFGNKGETVKVRRYKAGYEVHDEMVKYGTLKPVLVKSAYTPKGDYIGSPKLALFLCKKMGITKFQKRNSKHSGCSIGFNEDKQKWYGWSHRAIYGFGVGSEIKKGSVLADEGGFPIGYKAKTLNDAKKMASRFAEAVS